ncbi:hypothetical protein D3C87_2042800 [compost metagenome]
MFIDWLFASLEADSLPEPQTSARTLLRGRSGRASESFQPVSAPASRRTGPIANRKTRA